MKRGTTLFGLLLIDLGVVMATITMLPRAGSWMHSGPVSYFINSRTRWDIAWGTALSVVILSLGVYCLLEAKGAFDRAAESADADEDA